MSSEPQAHGAPARLILEVRWGALAHRKAVLAPKQTLRVGRADSAGFVVPGDKALAPEHFELSWDGATCQVSDLGSEHGIQLDGAEVRSAVVSRGSWIRAGGTDFSVHFEAFTPPPAPVPSEEAASPNCQRQALDRIRKLSGSLFMLLDAARDERILKLLRESVEEYRSLYRGPQGDTLEQVAPYLVALPRDSRLLEALVLEGWGKSWGVFLCCDLPIDDVRRHFRHFLMVKDPAGRLLYFRFYDPRVLDPFLSTCPPKDALRFCGPIKAFCFEGLVPEGLVRMKAQAHGLLREYVGLANPE